MEDLGGRANPAVELSLPESFSFSRNGHPVQPVNPSLSFFFEFPLSTSLSFSLFFIGLQQKPHTQSAQIPKAVTTIATAVPACCPLVQHFQAEQSGVAILPSTHPVACAGAGSTKVPVFNGVPSVLTTTPNTSVNTSTGNTVTLSAPASTLGTVTVTNSGACVTSG